MGRHIRRAFIAPPDHVLLSADYSQIELRVLAHLSQDEAFLQAFAQGHDFHATIAAKVYGVALADVTLEMRTTSNSSLTGSLTGCRRLEFRNGSASR